MLWSLLFVLLIGACKGGARKGDTCECSDGERICPEGEPTCQQGEPTCQQDFPFIKPESDWISPQSSDVGNNNKAEKAVDGKKETCTNENSWWMIDLQCLYDISSIAIYNKNNNDNIHGAQIYIGTSCENYDLSNQLVKNITDFKTDCWNVYQTNTLGRYITVSHPGEDFSLCEVRINATKTGPGRCSDEFPFNPTYSWITSQSSDFVGGNVPFNSTRAIDGKKTVCAHTKKEQDSWWMIDLLGVYNISSIAIYNILHHNINMTGARIHIGYSCKNNGTDNKLVTNITDFKMGCWNLYPTNTSGRYITVSLPGIKHLILCEVRINATEKEPACSEDFFQPNNDWITFQSSDDTKSCSGGAVGRYKINCAAILKIQNSLWRIDLLGVYDISSVAVYNKDLDEADMSDAWIQIGNSRMNSTEPNTNKLVTNITDFKMGCWNVYQTNTSGRYITVFLPGKEDFSLCEVRINATKKKSPFVLIRERKTWENALEHCRAKHRDLASILDEGEQAWAELEAKEADTEYVWLGLHYTCVLEFWFWVADYPLGFHHWAPKGKKEECGISVAMKKTEDHRWFSESVYDTFNFLCEK